MKLALYWHSCNFDIFKEMLASVVGGAKCVHLCTYKIRVHIYVFTIPYGRCVSYAGNSLRKTFRVRFGQLKSTLNTPTHVYG